MSLVRAEIIKLTGRKLYLLMVLILAVFVAITGFFLMVLPQVAPDVAEGLPVIPKPEIFTAGAQQVATQTWFAMVLAVVMLGGELNTTVWATGLTRDPRKARHIGARLLVLFSASWIAMVAATALWVALATVWASGEGTLGAGEWVDLLWRLGLVQLAWVSIGLGAVATLRSVGPAIGAALALSFGEGLLALWPPYESVSLGAATSGLFKFRTGGFLDRFIPGGDLTLAHSISIILGWTAIGVLLTYWGLVRRDA